MSTHIPRVVEKHYSARELCTLIGFDRRYWCDRMKAEPELKDAQGVVLATCVVIGGEFFAPACWVNAFIARHPVRYDEGIKARNTAELRRKLRAVPAPMSHAA